MVCRWNFQGKIKEESVSFIHYLIVIGLPGRFLSNVYTARLFKLQIIPLVYGLLVGENSTDYERFFQCIMEEDDFNPESILTDFDAATIKVINSLFPNVSHKGNNITFFKIIL